LILSRDLGYLEAGAAEPIEEAIDRLARRLHVLRTKVAQAASRR